LTELNNEAGFMTWIVCTFLAAFAQAWRNALQSQFSAHASIATVTLSRFILASPIAALYLIVLSQFHPTEHIQFNTAFMIYIGSASITQILATALMVILFKQNNYAVGAGLAKSEALVAAIFGMLFFGSTLSFFGWLGVIIGGAAVLILSGFTVKNVNFPTALLGLSCGSAFALTSLWIREAALISELPFPYSAAWVLLLVISIQTILLSLYLLLKEPQSFAIIWQHRRKVSAISFTSCIGSIGWFSAMSLQHVAYVKTLGQIEVFFTMLIATFWLKHPVKRRDGLGLILIALAAVLVMLT
jgi:drug/metabolite transporter (DMT)-like permease